METHNQTSETAPLTYAIPLKYKDIEILNMPYSERQEYIAIIARDINNHPSNITPFFTAFLKTFDAAREKAEQDLTANPDKVKYWQNAGTDPKGIAIGHTLGSYGAALSEIGKKLSQSTMAIITTDEKLASALKQRTYYQVHTKATLNLFSLLTGQELVQESSPASLTAPTPRP